MKNLVCVMQYIHGENIIHRDLKPSNIFVTENNELIIGDFGLAIEKDKSDHQFAGTRNYIAPEIYDNERDPPYSEASDIFSLGCIFYEIYTLRKLYDGIDNDEIKNKILNDREIHFERNGMKISDIEKLIIRMINKNPEKRIKLHDIIARMKIIEEDLDILSESDPIIANISSYASSSTTATTSNTFDHHHNLTVGFYLYGDTVEGMTLKEMSSVNQNDFNKKWKSRYVDILFPVVGQDNPPFSYEDSMELKNRKDKYEENLKILLSLLKNLDEDMLIPISDQVQLFLNEIGLPYKFNKTDSSNNSYNAKFSHTTSFQSPPPPIPPPKTTTSTTTTTAVTRKVPICQRGDLHPSRWIYITDVEIPNCPPQVTSLYYERPDEGNRLLSVNGEPPDYHPKGIVQGSAGLDYSFLQKINYGNWWCETKEEEFKYVPVYQRGGKHPSKWIFKENAPIKKEYKDIIRNLYYARSNEGNELLSVNGEPPFQHLNGRQVQGAIGIPRDYLNRMSQFGWWRY